MSHVPRLYRAGSLGPGSLVLEGDTATRLTTVMRMRLGEPFVLFCGDGREWHATVSSAGRGTLTVTVSDVARQATPPAVVLETWIGTATAGRLDTAVEKCVEAGADIIKFFGSEFSSRSDAASPNRLERWQRIVVEAAEQCGRLYLPLVEYTGPLARALDVYRGPLVVAERQGRSAAELQPLLPGSGHLAFVVGPAGGLSPAELGVLDRRGALRLTLGPHILRSETAAIVGTAVLRSLTV
jgi:16S rRNA (uracil1498-N3)-methyltransferase